MKNLLTKNPNLNGGNRLNSWDKTWEEIFQTREWGKYPPEELVRFIARNFYKVPTRKDIKILDLGCGTGAGAWYAAREGFSVYGIDGSKTAINIAKDRFRKENLDGIFKVEDFIKLDFEDNFFDAVIDICSIQHNEPKNQKIILDEIFRVLKPGRKVFSMLISKKSRFNRRNDPFIEKIFIYLFEENEITNLFSNFKNLTIEISERTDRGSFISYFIVSGEK